MTTELTYLTLTKMLAASLWIPYIVGVNKHPQDGHDPFERPAPLSGFPPWCTARTVPTSTCWRARCPLACCF